MERRVRRYYNYKFAEKSSPPWGLLSLGMAVVSFLILLVLVIVSSQASGNAGIGIGLLGLLAFGCSCGGLGLFIMAKKKEESSSYFQIVAVVWNSVLIVVYLALYIFGAYI